MIFRQFLHTAPVAASYLFGCGGLAQGVVVDPVDDIAPYQLAGRETGMRIVHVIDTHIHADHVSGGLALAEAVGATYHVHESIDAPEDARLTDEQELSVGNVTIRVWHTPGHTPEHISYLLADTEHPETPWGVLSGDSLFVNSAGRPDLLGEKETGKLAAQQFHTLSDFYMKLPDSVIIYPAHGSGSPCGAEIGDRLNSTIGYERPLNPFLQFKDVESFTRFAVSTAPPIPKYYPRMKKVNMEGPEVLGGLPRVAGLPPKAFKKAIDEKAGILIDTRLMLSFGGAHIPGALNIGGSPMLSIWAGSLLDPEQPILLVLENDDDLDEIVRLFIRTGFTKFAGYLVGGMKAWDNAGYPFAQVAQMSVHDLKNAGRELQILDVRSNREWKGGHVPGAHHIFLAELWKRFGELDKSKPTAVYCASGYRASIAASILKGEGFADVRNVPGSWHAWKKAGYPVDRNAAQEKAA